MFFRLCLCFYLCLCLCLCLYLYPCFCFCLCFSLSVSVSILVSVFYSYLPLLRVFVSYRKEVVRFPVDLSGRGAEQRFCVFYPYFPSSVRRGAASDRVVYRKHGYSAQSGGRTLFHDHLSTAFSGLFGITKVCFV